MKKKIGFIISLMLTLVLISFKNNRDAGSYQTHYTEKLQQFEMHEKSLVTCIQTSDLNLASDRDKIRQQIELTRNELKGMDFWFRYLEPTVYKQINGPLPVEWETEVFEKYEKPYKREGAGLTLAYLYLEEENPDKNELLKLVELGLQATATYAADSITKELDSYHHFFLCNRLYLLNMAAIYTTGFECPDTERIIPELKVMLKSVHETYQNFNATYPATQVNNDYIELYRRMEEFVEKQPEHYSSFDHFVLIRDYVNPLFAINQQMIRDYRVSSRSMVDYSLNKTSNSIFSKSLYYGQNSKGIFLRVTDEEALAEIDRLGKMLFYDPILSGNNQRSCASCHQPTEYFTDTNMRTSLQFDHSGFLARNTPSLINVGYNHLVMMDGKHISLQHQTRDVITNSIEMGSDEKACLNKVLSCKTYKSAFKKLLKYTPTETDITFEHIVSAITFYYSKFSQYSAPFDEAMNRRTMLDASAKAGFNLFMSKAQCATCHFAPHFNGVKPPYVGSEFEVLGVPKDTGFHALSPDKGRYDVNPAVETLHAFRTGTLRNTTYTAPYMHNGVFGSMLQVIDFYNAGGGAGRGLEVDNQTLSSDSLGLTHTEKLKLIQFMKSLDEKVTFEQAPEALPLSADKSLNRRKVGGEY